MPKEPPMYREILRGLREAFPEKAILSKADVMKYTGKKEWWADHHGFKGRYGFPIETVAMTLAKLN